MNTNKTQAEQLPQVAVMQSVLAKDLRLGNLILKNGKIYEITTLFFVDLHDGTVRENYNNSYVIEPIPLTEEWLFKFGFKKLNQVPQYHIEDFHVYTTKNYSKIFGLHFDVKIKHVHQLQNLYFALTQHELTVA